MNRVWNKIDSRTICWGGEWDDVKTTVRATVFAVMMELARDRVKHYVSDLYHDAVWLNESLTGQMQFDWVARESGTFIGESASNCKLGDWEKAIKYRFEIRVNEKNKWMLHMYEDSPLVSGSQGQIVEKFALPNVPDTVQSSPGSALWLQNPDSVPNWGTEEVFVGTQEMGEDDPLDVSCIGYKTPSGIEHGFEDHDKDNCPVHGSNLVEHVTLPVGLCELATTAAGCIYHPAPPISKFHSYSDEEKIAIAEATFPELIKNRVRENETFPTLRNDSTQTIKGVFNMDDILRDLREKLDEANSARDEAYDAKTELDDAISEFDEYIDAVDNLISSLDDLPALSVDLDVRVSFES